MCTRQAGVRPGYYRRGLGHVRLCAQPPERTRRFDCGAGVCVRAKLVFGLAIIGAGWAVYGFVRSRLNERAALIAALVYVYAPSWCSAWLLSARAGPCTALCAAA